MNTLVSNGKILQLERPVQHRISLILLNIIEAYIEDAAFLSKINWKKALKNCFVIEWLSKGQR